MEMGRAVSEICQIDKEMSQLIEKYARSNKTEVRIWLCELLADLNEKRTRIVNKAME